MLGSALVKAGEIVELGQGAVVQSWGSLGPPTGSSGMALLSCPGWDKGA